MQARGQPSKRASNCSLTQPRRLMLPVLLQRAFSCTVSGCEYVDTLGYSHPLGASVQPTDVSTCVCLRMASRDVKWLCELGCTSTGINKWREVMAETCLRADSTGEREITDCEEEESTAGNRSRWIRWKLGTCRSGRGTECESRRGKWGRRGLRGRKKWIIQCHAAIASHISMRSEF